MTSKRKLFPGIDDRLPVAEFSRQWFGGFPLRDYQAAPAQAILDSVHQQRGEHHVVVFSRQAGKDELLAQLVIQILIEHRQTGGNVILAAPTFRPQGLTMRDRLMERMRDAGFDGLARAREGMIVDVGKASARFLSASPVANARGQTASLLLVANETQDILPEQWDAVFSPMAATTNATTVFLGTVWSRHTLLARQMRHLEQEADGGSRRVWKVTWDVVARQLPAYDAHVRGRIAQLGENHPHIRTEYFLEELGDAGSLFSESMIEQMQGDHSRLRSATDGKRYALMIDVAGESEAPIAPGMADWTGRRDSTALTVVEIGEPQLEGLAGYGEQPVYRVVDRMAWTGTSHAVLHGRIVDLARRIWKASVVIVDATGVGAGLASFLQAELSRRSAESPPIRVMPFHFTARSKSQLAWDFIGLIDSGRYREYEERAPAGSAEADLTAAFWAQLRSIEHEVSKGPGKLMTWGTPPNRGHDDLVISAAMTALLDQVDMRVRVARGA